MTRGARRRALRRGWRSRGGEGPFSVELHDARGAGEEGLLLVAARVTRPRAGAGTDS